MIKLFIQYNVDQPPQSVMQYYTFCRIMKVAIVTGGNKGVGFGICRGLAKAFDGDVLLTARNEERGMNAVKELEKDGLTVKFHLLDINDPKSVGALAAFIKEKYGGIDVLVNNAAIAFKQAATEPFALQAKVTIATNYFSVQDCCNQLFPLLRSGARVVNVSSMAGFLGLIKGADLKSKFASSGSTLTYEVLDGLMKDFVDSANAGDHAAKGWPNSTYVVSKVGLSAMTRIQQQKVSEDSSLKDVAINHVHPGYVDTDMSSHKGHLSIDEGAKSALFAATLPPNTEVKGQYIWSDCQIIDWVNGPCPGWSS